MKKHSTAANALWLIFGRLAQGGLSLLVGILTARFLGPEDYGLLHYAAGFTAFFAPFCTLGLPAVLVRELTEKPEAEGTLLGTAFALEALGSLCSAGTILLLVSLLHPEDAVMAAVVGLSCAAMVLRSPEVFQQCFQARLQARVTALVLLLSHSLGLLCKAAFLVLQKEVAWFALGTVLEALSSGIGHLLAYRRLSGPKLSFSREIAGELLQKSRHFLLPGLMVAICSQADRILLTQLLGQGETGYYSAAVSLSTGWCFVLSAVIDAAFPEITRAYTRDRSLFERKNRQLYGFVFRMSAAVSLVLCLLAEPLVLTLYGEDYRAAVAPLRILTWCTGFSYLGTARNAWVVCREAQDALVWVYAAAAAANAALNLLLIPRFGASGAAAASLAAQTVSALIAPRFLNKLRENSRLMLQAIQFIHKEETP